MRVGATVFILNSFRDTYARRGRRAAEQFMWCVRMSRAYKNEKNTLVGCEYEARFDDSLLVARRFEYFLKWGVNLASFFHCGEVFGVIWKRLGSILELPGRIWESFWGVLG